MKWLLFPTLFFRALCADFSFSLCDEICSDQENWVFSPFSIHACLSMVAAGASGKTAEDLREILSLPEEIGPAFEKKIASLKHTAASDTDFQLHIAQGVWVQEDYPILPAYSDLLRLSFQAAAESVRFSPYMAKKINSWIAHETNEKIQNLIPPDALTEETRIVLANALYFHGSWLHPFSESSTSPRPFHLSSGRVVEVPTMSQTSRFPYFRNEKLQAVLLPFARAHDAEAEPACLLVLAEAFGEKEFREILSSLQMHKVQLQAPKFTLEQGFDLSRPLQALGLKKAFSPHAEFSGIGGRNDLCLSTVLHKSFFSFEEKGVEAAAATAAIIVTTTAIRPPEPVISFIADRPFYFVLFDRKTEEILFLGQVHNPIN